jgi:hypothetical protein
MVLMMVYSIQNYWVIGLCPSSDILKHNVSESVSVLRGGGEHLFYWVS